MYQAIILARMMKNNSNNCAKKSIKSVAPTSAEKSPQNAAALATTNGFFQQHKVLKSSNCLDGKRPSR